MSELKWSEYPREFDAACQAIENEEMAEFDWTLGMVWCPAGLDHNQPINPNILKSWGKAFSELPESHLKVKVWHAVKAVAEERGESFADAFTESFPDNYPEWFAERFGKGSRNGSTAAPAAAAEPAAKPAAKRKRKRRIPGPQPGDYAATPDFMALFNAYPNKRRQKQAHAAYLKAVRESRIIPSDADVGPGPGAIAAEELLAQVEDRARRDRQWVKDAGAYVPTLAHFIDGNEWTDQWDADPVRALMHVGEQERGDARPEAGEEKRRKAVEIITRYVADVEAAKLPAGAATLASAHAAELRELAGNAEMPRGEMAERFFDLSDAFLAELYMSLGKSEREAVDDGRPAQANPEAYRRARLRARFHLPDPYASEIE